MNIKFWIIPFQILSFSLSFKNCLFNVSDVKKKANTCNEGNRKSFFTVPLNGQNIGDGCITFWVDHFLRFIHLAAGYFL